MHVLTDNQAALLSAVLFAVYIVVIVSSMLTTGHGGDPQRGQAVGCLGLVVATLALLECVVFIGWRYHLPRLIHGSTILALLPLALLLLNGAEAAYRAIKQR